MSDLIKTPSITRLDNTDMSGYNVDVVVIDSANKRITLINIKPKSRSIPLSSLAYLAHVAKLTEEKYEGFDVSSLIIAKSGLFSKISQEIIAFAKDIDVQVVLAHNPQSIADDVAKGYVRFE